MLVRHFGLQLDPFGTTPDPRFLYRSETHREALASLQYGYYSNHGFTALIAAPGMGKTTLLFQFLDAIQETARSVFLFYTQCEPQELLRYILQDLGITPGQEMVEMHQQLNDALVKEARAKRRFVVVIDEAQNLPRATLETVRMLTNFETARAKLIQIVLSGQPELYDKLADPSLVQLRQRVSIICRLKPLNAEETAEYVKHRLEIAGYSGVPLFTDEAMKLLVGASQGIPRTINNLCFNALSLCCALKSKRVDASMMAEAIADQQIAPQSTKQIPDNSPTPVAQVAKERKRLAPPARLWATAAVAVLLLATALGAIAIRGRYSFAAIRDMAGKVLPASLFATESNKAGQHSGTDLSLFNLGLTNSNGDFRDFALRRLGFLNDDFLHEVEVGNFEMGNPN